MVECSCGCIKSVPNCHLLSLPSIHRCGDLQEVLQNIKLPDADGKSPTIAINLVLQFLFYELRYRTDVRKWFYRKLSLELDELLTKTTTGKLFDKLSVSSTSYVVVRRLRVTWSH